MVSLWGSKNSEEAEGLASGNEELISDNPAYHRADERTRLLHPPPPDGYLSPDDPAISPYNLWSVRFLRYFSVFFTILTFTWWILLLVSIFTSPPGMYSRGSGFFDFSFTSLALGLLLVVLLFFSTPSKAAQVTCLVIAVFLLLDVMIIVAIPGLRVEEGWVGISSVVWALAISIWTIVTDRIVTWGKHEEEERLTGRPETRRTLLEWLAVFASELVLITIAVVAILLSCTLILRARDSSLPAPGQKYLVDGNKHQLHLFCSSNKSTDDDGERVLTVLFEAGDGPFEHSMIQIAEYALANRTIGRYCYSDRPGIAWSENAPSPFSAGMAADALSEALARAGETGPWILASAGVGSIYSRIFSSRHGRDVKGLLMINPLHEDLLYRLGSPSRGFLLWARGVMSPLGLDRIPGVIFKGRTREDRVYGRSAYQGGNFIKAKLQESLVANSLTKSEVHSARTIQNESVPLALISSGIEVKKDGEWESKQRDLSHLTKRLLSWDIVNKAPADVWTTLEGRKVIERRLKNLVEL